MLLVRFRRLLDLRIGAKLLLLLIAAAMPFFLMTATYVAQANKNVAFAQLEISGADYLEALAPLFVAVTREGTGGADGGVIAAARARAERFDPLFKSQDAMKAFLEAAGKPDRLLALEAAKNAAQKIGDGSNLTLDPDLDSYYLMDTVIMRLPELMAASVELRRAAAPFLRSGTANLPEFAGLIAARTRLERAREGLIGSLNAAMESNADGSVRAAVTGRGQRFLELAHRLTSLADNAATAAENGRKLPEPQALVEQADMVLSAGGDLSAIVLSELKRVIGLRIDGFHADMIRQLSVQLGFFLLAIAIGVLILRSIRRPISDLIAAIRRFQAGDFQSAVPHVDSRSEFGEIARALTQFRMLGANQALTNAAVEASGTMLMITDPQERIVSLSGSLQGLLATLAPALRAAEPDFDAAQLIGRHVDCCRANPAMAATMLAEGAMRYEIGGRVIDVDGSDICSDGGAVIGRTLIWRDVSTERATEREIAGVVQAASRGDFETNLDLAGKSGAAREIALGLNAVSATVRKATLEFAEALSAMAQGDLSRMITTGYDGVFASLRDAVNQTGAQLAQTIAALKRTAHDLAVSATEISTGAGDLAGRTEEQASALVATAATTEELVASVKASAGAVRTAAGQADAAMALAQRGGDIARDAVGAISRIQEMSRRITDITSVIDEIAFQTNLLALNAAVEAARAGDAGKGFAVVAAEVRSLAQRSAGAARDIGDLLAGSSREVDQGVSLVRSAGEALDEIVGASRQLAQNMAGIADASGAQASGIDEISRTLDQMDATTQRNATLAEQSRGAALTLDRHVGALNQIAARFVTEARPREEPLRLAS